MEELMYISDKPKKKMSSTALQKLRKDLGYTNLISDAFKALKI